MSACHSIDDPWSLLPGFKSDVATFASARGALAEALATRTTASLQLKHQPPHAGLENQGGTCYLNSLIQALFSTEALRRAVLAWRYDADLHGPLVDCLPAQLQLLFARLILSDAAAASTVGLTTSFGWSGFRMFFVLSLGWAF